MNLRILLADNHKIFRAALRALLEAESDFEIIGEADEGAATAKLAIKLSPQVVITDVTMQPVNGIAATRLMLADNPGIKVIALATHCHSRFIRAMLTAGAVAYLPKECSLETLLRAIRAVGGRDGIFLPPEIAGGVLHDYLQVRRHGELASGVPLSLREQMVLQQVVAGDTSADIAGTLHTSVGSVKRHRAEIGRKLDIHTLAGLVRYALREGIAAPGQQVDPELPASMGHRRIDHALPHRCRR